MSLDLEGQILSLRMMYGDDHGALISGTLTLQLVTLDENTGAFVELDSGDCPGYTSASITNNSTNFPDPDAEGLLTSALFTVCTASADWDIAHTHWHLFDGSTALDRGEVSSDQIPNSGDVIKQRCRIFYGSGGDV